MSLALLVVVLMTVECSANKPLARAGKWTSSVQINAQGAAALEQKTAKREIHLKQEQKLLRDRLAEIESEQERLAATSENDLNGAFIELDEDYDDDDAMDSGTAPSASALDLGRTQKSVGFHDQFLKGKEAFDDTDLYICVFHKVLVRNLLRLGRTEGVITRDLMAASMKLFGDDGSTFQFLSPPFDDVEAEGKLGVNLTDLHKFEHVTSTNIIDPVPDKQRFRKTLGKFARKNGGNVSVDVMLKANQTILDLFQADVDAGKDHVGTFPGAGTWFGAVGVLLAFFGTGPDQSLSVDEFKRLFLKGHLPEGYVPREVSLLKVKSGQPESNPALAKVLYLLKR